MNTERPSKIVKYVYIESTQFINYSLTHLMNSTSLSTPSHINHVPQLNMNVLASHLECRAVTNYLYS